MTQPHAIAFARDDVADPVDPVDHRALGAHDRSCGCVAPVDARLAGDACGDEAAVSPARAVAHGLGLDDRDPKRPGPGA